MCVGVATTALAIVPDSNVVVVKSEVEVLDGGVDVVVEDVVVVVGRVWRWWMT